MTSKKPPDDLELNREILVQAVESVIPEFAKACLANIDVITIAQEEFASDYNVDDCTLLGMAIKYAGVKGKEVRVLRKQPPIN
jgi:hypothetical protein